MRGGFYNLQCIVQSKVSGGWEKTLEIGNSPSNTGHELTFPASRHVFLMCLCFVVVVVLLHLALIRASFFLALGLGITPGALVTI